MYKKILLLIMVSTLIALIGCGKDSESSDNSSILEESDKIGIDPDNEIDIDPDNEIGIDQNLQTALSSSTAVHVLYLDSIDSEDSKYLGCWTCSSYDSNSIHNDYSTYGNKYNSDSIRNNYGSYGNPYSSKSPCNSFLVTDAPYLYDENHNYFGRLSLNEVNFESICTSLSKFYHADSCTLLKTYCD